MSYELYCYRSTIGKPDVEEAQLIIEDSSEFVVNTEVKVKNEIVKALLTHDSRLEVFKLDYEEIARLQKISIEEARKTFDYVELNRPEEDLARQITVFNESVTIIVPYWYTGNNAKEVFEQVNEYTKVIGRVAGMYVYDPQVDRAYDPLVEDFDGLSVYRDVTEQTHQSTTNREIHKIAKPWWKFW